MARPEFEKMLGADPTEWLLGSDEPYTAWVTHTRILGAAGDALDVLEARERLLTDARVGRLVDSLPIWGDGDFPGHHSPKFLPNKLNLLADMGVGGGDFDGIEALLDGMLEHQDSHGRFQAFGKYSKDNKPDWGSLLCDTNVITYVLLRYGRTDDEHVTTALDRMRSDMQKTPQGLAWRCEPEKRSLFRGPGRKSDLCPQVTLEGLRALSMLPPQQRPSGTLEAARTPLEVWRRRTEERPYMFGHGFQFKSVKWPDFWYDVLWVVETLGRFPGLWSGADAEDDDVQALAEMAACLIAYNFDEDGRVTPKRVYRGFEEFSFGQKKEPSPFATARCLAALVRVEDLADRIAGVDVTALPSSKGGSGTPVPPKTVGRIEPEGRTEKAEPACPVPVERRDFTMAQAVGRVLARQHLGVPGLRASVGSVVTDIVGLHATNPTGPYLALGARLPRFDRSALDEALFVRRSLVRVRCMRGKVFIVPTLEFPAVFASTSEPVIRHSRNFAKGRGLTPELYEKTAPKVLEALAEEPMTSREIGSRLDLGVDVAALVNLMCNEGLLLRDRPPGGWRDRRWRYASTSEVLPELVLGELSQEEGDQVLVRDYVRAFGPVSARDVAWWTGVGPKRLGRVLGELDDEFVEVTLDGVDKPFMLHASDLEEVGALGTQGTHWAAFLPSLDPLMMAFTRYDHLVDEAVRSLVFDRTGNATSVILHRDRVVGVWDATDEPEPTIMVHLFEELDARGLEAVEGGALEAARLRHGGDSRVEWIEEMVPLPERPHGAYVKPLR